MKEKPRRHVEQAQKCGRAGVDPRHAAAAELRAGLLAGVRSRLWHLAKRYQSALVPFFLEDVVKKPDLFQPDASTLPPRRSR